MKSYTKNIISYTKLFLLFTVTSTIFIACDVSVKYEFPDGGRKIVLNSIINTDEPISVNLAVTMPVSSHSYNKDSLGHTTTLKEPTYIDNAIVLIYENDILLDTLSFVGNGDYVSTYIPRTGCKYKVVAQSEDYGSCYAETKIGNLPIIENVGYQNGIATDHEGNPLSKVFFKIKDTDADRNFYKIAFYYEADEDDWRDTRNVVFNATDNSDKVVIQNSSIFFINTYLLITDDYFRNSSYNLEAICKKIPSTPTIEFSVISESYYEYLLSKAKQNFVDDGLMGESHQLVGLPTNIYTNVENGYGIFASYSTKCDTIWQ